MTSTDNGLGTPGSVLAEVREGDYGAKVAAIEPGGAEFIPLADRHGTPDKLFWTWMSPNLEFATVFVGVISVLYFGLTVWQAVAAIVLGNLLGSLSTDCSASGARSSACRRWCSRGSRSASAATSSPPA